MNSEDDESRSERLRRRRQRSSESAQPDVSEPSEPSEPEEQSKPSKLSEPSKPSEPSKLSEPSVKEEQVGTYMYLPQSQKKELDRLYNMLKAEYEYEFDQDFEKNRHFFPLVVQYGLDSLDSLDASEIKNRLESI